MKTIIAGSRSITEYIIVEHAIKSSPFVITTVVSGTAKGVDTLGELYAHNHNIPIIRFPADWNKYGKKAGYLRNMEMAENADALIAIYDGVSKGTAHMINIAERRGLPVFIYNTYQMNNTLYNFT